MSTHTRPDRSHHPISRIAETPLEHDPVVYLIVWSLPKRKSREEERLEIRHHDRRRPGSRRGDRRRAGGHAGPAAGAAREQRPSVGRRLRA